MGQFILDFEPEFIDFFQEGNRARNLVCPNCGFEFPVYSQTGRLGCSKCYDVFAAQLLPIIDSIHGCVKHNGSRPI